MDIKEYIENEEKKLNEIVQEIEKTNNYLALGKGNYNYHIEMLEALDKNLKTMRKTLSNAMIKQIKTDEDREAFNDFSTKLGRAEGKLDNLLEALEEAANTQKTFKNKPDIKSDAKAPPITRRPMKAIGAAIGSALLVLLGLAAAATVVGLPLAIPLIYYGAKFFNKSVNNYRNEKAIAGMNHGFDQTSSKFESVDLTQDDNKRGSWVKAAATEGRNYGLDEPKEDKLEHKSKSQVKTAGYGLGEPMEEALRTQLIDVIDEYRGDAASKSWFWDLRQTLAKGEETPSTVTAGIYARKLNAQGLEELGNKMLEVANKFHDRKELEKTVPAPIKSR